jgi:hypothetical protein
MRRSLYFWLVAAALMVGAVVLAVTRERIEDVDLHSGRMRIRWLVAGKSLSKRIVETDFSQIAARHSHFASLPRWRAVHRWSPLRPESHYTFGGVPSVLSNFVWARRLDFIPEADEARVVREILDCLEKEDLQALSKVIRTAMVEPRKADVKE